MIPRNLKEHWLRTTAVAAVAAAFSLITAMPSYAQEPAEEAVAEEEDLIIVTGSRIARDANLDSPTAVVTIDSESIDLQGSSNIADILREAPATGVSAITGTNSNFTLASGGINTLELRNLGESRTLVLVNGRRFVAGLPGTNIVDMNYIPTALVERVEVITGGASSIYGSDALAGVVNIIMKDDFEGVETELQYGKDEFGTNEEWEAELTVGGNFGNGRGNAVVHFNYTQNLGIPSNSRPDLRVDGSALCIAPFLGVGVSFEDAPFPESCDERFEPVLSSFPPQGRYVIEDFISETATSYTLRDGEIVLFNNNPAAGPVDGFNRQQFRTVLVPFERFVVSSTADYDIYPWMTAYFEGTYASVENNTRLEPVPLNSGLIFENGTSATSLGHPVFIPGVEGDIINPLIPEDLVEIALEGEEDSIGFVRRLVEVGPRGLEIIRQTFRAVGGLKGDFLAFDDKTYNYDMFFNYGRTTRDQVNDSSIVKSKFAEALDIEQVENESGELVLQCRDEAARKRGCVPINIFGEGSISPEAADYVRAIELRHANIRQEQYGGTFTGPIPYMTLPAGDIQITGGVEYRRKSSGDQPGDILKAGLSSSNQISFDGGSFKVFETFGEIEIPIFRDVPFAKDFTVGAATRWSSYNPQGETLAYSFRASFQPVDSVRFRFQYAQAVRAPNIAELFNTGTQNFATVTDPCNDISDITDPDPDEAATAANCLADPAVAARVAATGGFNLSGSETQAAGGFSGTGNQNLDPEKGTSYTAGMVYDDNWGSAGNVTFSVDWFDIYIEDAIAQPARQFVVDECFINGNPLFCDFITRDLSGLGSQQGEITAINTAVVNAGFLSTAGIDVAVNYSLDLNNLHSGGMPSLGLNDLGQASINIQYTYLLEYESEIFGSFEDDRGEQGAFEHEILGAFTYLNGPFTFQWRTIYNDGGPVNNDGFFSPIILDEYVKSDMTVRYTVSEPFNSGAEVNFFFGIDNVLDADTDQVLPFITGNATGTNTNPAIYDPIGRSYYGGIKIRY